MLCLFLLCLNFQGTISTALIFPSVVELVLELLLKEVAWEQDMGPNF